MAVSLTRTLGASQLLSVPYAMYAAAATAPVLTITGISLSAGGNTVTLPSGPAGPAGATGAIGATGATGAAGTTGPAGATGPARATGPAGALGLTGPTGPIGATGPAGATGSYTAGTVITIASGTISASNLTGDVSCAPNATTVTKLQGISVSAEIQWHCLGARGG